MSRSRLVRSAAAAIVVLSFLIAVSSAGAAAWLRSQIKGIQRESDERLKAEIARTREEAAEQAAQRIKAETQEAEAAPAPVAGSPPTADAAAIRAEIEREVRAEADQRIEAERERLEAETSRRIAEAEKTATQTAPAQAPAAPQVQEVLTQLQEAEARATEA